MTTIKLVADDQSLEVSQNPVITSGEENTVVLHVDFSSDWNGFGKTAVFFTEKNKTTLYEKVMTSGECIVPSEVMVNEGTFLVGIRGVNSTNKQVKTTSLVKYKILQGTPAVIEFGPTPDVYEQLLGSYGKLDSAVTNLNSAVTNLNSDIAVERARIDSLSTLPEGSTTGDAELLDIRVKADGSTATSAGNAVREQVSELKSDLADGNFGNNSIKPFKLNGFNISGNIVPLFEKKEIGKYYVYYGETNAIATYYSENYNTILLPIKKNTHYSTTTYRFMILLTSNEIKAENVVGNGESSSGFDSENATYVLLSYLASNEESFSVSEGTSLIKETKYSYDWLQVNSKLKGKKVINFGDSIAENRTESQSYCNLMCKKTGAIWSLNYAAGGATVSLVEGQTMGCILSQVRTCINGHPSSQFNYDIALIDGGANDYSQNRQVGAVVKTSNHYSLDDYTATFDTTTFLGALEECFRLLRATYTNLIIVFVICHKHNRLDDKWQSMVDGMREACEKWSICVLDMDKDGQLNSRISAMRTLYTDESGTHQNTLGNEKFYVPQLINLLEKYIN